MKKVFALSLTLLMLVSMSLSVFAMPGGAFISSPSTNDDPELISFSLEADCGAQVVLTPYADKDALPEADKAALKAAYDAIRGTTDLNTLESDLTALADKLSITTKTMAVSDLFDLSIVGCDNAEHATTGHGTITITVKISGLNNFVGVLHMNDGEWELVDGAKAKDETITFQVDDLSPFAIVVDADENSPITGDMHLYILGAIMVLSAVALIICYKKSRKVVD